MPNILNPHSIKALALDLDGTALRPGNILSDRTLAALRSCMSKGIEIILCTGRAVEAAEKYRVPMGAAGPMVYFNGAEVVDMPGRKVLSATLLGKEVVDFCTDISRSMGVHYQVFFPAAADAAIAGEAPHEILMIEKPGPEAEMYRDHTGIVPVTGDIKKAVAGFSGCIKSMFIADPAIHEVIRSKLLERFGDTIYVARTYPTFLEVMNAAVNKGEGLRYAMEQRGLKPEQVIALGDEENDLPMFSVAGFSVAPANAKEKVKSAADLVTGPNTEDGAAAFLEETFGV
ncbi:MAG: Cof-type HAD-IIB family hydrolase [Treponema sp.]|jgi:Cof subfamily protein (haloacid dehalogenase superfamily)|nr:Cof-type HAD-IIB family hydrolase [Treponema sp.]